MSAQGRPAADARAELHEVQRGLAALLTAAGPIDDGDQAVAALLRPLAGAAPRLSIYRDAYRARLVAALRSNYPVLHRVLGDDDFAALALAYLAAHPSRQPSIRWFGHVLADWLDARLAVDADALPHPALADLARMEWAIGSSFDAADAAPLSFADLAQVPVDRWPALRFAPHPSLRRVGLQWAVEPIWRALTADENADTAPPEPLEHRLLVWRIGLDTRWRAIEPDEDAALARCLAGERFDAVCAALAALAPDDAGAEAQSAAQVAGWLRGWVDAGLLLPAADDRPLPSRPN